MKRWPLVGLALAVLWLFVNGVAPTIDSFLGGVLAGLAVGMPVAFAFRRFYNPEIEFRDGLSTVPAAGLYVLLFLWELLTANVDVAYRTLSPSMPIEPAVIEVPLRVRTDLAVTTIANSITLTPGTLTMDYDEERNSLYVHAIAGSDPDAVVEPIRQWEDYALVIFDEELKPRDPVPDPDARGEAADGGGESDGE